MRLECFAHLNAVLNDLSNLAKTCLDAFSIFGATPGQHQEISQVSARILTVPPPSVRGESMFFHLRDPGGRYRVHYPLF